MYSEKIIEEFLNPKNFGVIRGANGVGKVVSDIGNEIIKIYISVDGGKIVDAQFQTFGGVVAIALTSFATSMIKGMPVSNAEKLTANDLVKVSGPIPENKSYLVTAVVTAVRKAVSSFVSKSAKDD